METPSRYSNQQTGAHWDGGSIVFDPAVAVDSLSCDAGPRTAMFICTTAGCETPPPTLQRGCSRDLHLGLRRRGPGREHERITCSTASRTTAPSRARTAVPRARRGLIETVATRSTSSPTRPGSWAAPAASAAAASTRSSAPARATPGTRRSTRTRRAICPGPVRPPARAIRNRRRGVHQYLRDFRHAEQRSTPVRSSGRSWPLRTLLVPAGSRPRVSGGTALRSSCELGQCTGRGNDQVFTYPRHHQLGHMDADRHPVGRPRDRRSSNRATQTTSMRRTWLRPGRRWSSRPTAAGQLDERSRAGRAASDRERHLPLPEHTRSLDQQRRRGHLIGGLCPTAPARHSNGQREHHHRWWIPIFLFLPRAARPEPRQKTHLRLQGAHPMAAGRCTSTTSRSASSACTLRHPEACGPLGADVHAEPG